MKVIVEISKEFESHYNSDKFSESLARIEYDINSLGYLSGLYEIETLSMLKISFENSEVFHDENI